MDNTSKTKNINSIIQIQEIVTFIKFIRYQSIGQVLYYHISIISIVLGFYAVIVLAAKNGTADWVRFLYFYSIIFLIIGFVSLKSSIEIIFKKSISKTIKNNKNHYNILKNELIRDFEPKAINPLIAELDKEINTAIKKHNSIKRSIIVIYSIAAILLVSIFIAMPDGDLYSIKTLINTNTNNALEKNFKIKPYTNVVDGALKDIFEIDNKEYFLNFSIAKENNLYDDDNLYENVFILIPDIRLIQKQDFDTSLSVKLIITLTNKNGVPIKNIPDICLNSSPRNKIQLAKEEGLALCNFISYYIDTNQEKTFNKINYLINQDIYFIVNSFIMK